MLLGHASVQTTERYLGTAQNLVQAPNDAIRLSVVVSFLQFLPSTEFRVEKTLARLN
jgi:hypothetical protein